MTAIPKRIIRPCQLLRDYYEYGGARLAINAVIMRCRTILSLNTTEGDQDRIIVKFGGNKYEVLTEFPSEQEWRRYEAGVIEPEVKRPMRDVLNDGDVVIDVGAFCGDTALYSHSLVGETGKIIAFEPDPYLCDITEKNVNLNAIENVEIQNVAIGDRSGTLQASAILGNTRKEYQNQMNDDFTVEVRSLNDILRSIDREPALVKIDVDGAEYSALNGAEDLLGTYPILLELHHDELLKKWDETVDYIFERTNQVSYMGAQGLAPNRHRYGTVITQKADLDRSVVTNLLLQ